MKYENIKESLKKVLALVEDCERNGASAMEYDLILKELREVYSAVRFEGLPSETEPAPTEPESCAAAQPDVAETTECENEPKEEAAVPTENDNKPAVETPAFGESSSLMRRKMIVRSLYEADIIAETPAETPVVEQPVACTTEEQPAADAPAVDSEDSIIAESPAATAEEGPEAAADSTTKPDEAPEATEELPEPAAEGLTEATEPEETAEAESGTEETTEPVADEVPATAEPGTDENMQETGQQSSEQNEDRTPEPHFTPDSGEVVLGEIINADVQTFADTITVSDEVVGNGAITNLKEAIGLNDRFLLTNELFNGNAETFDSVIEKLDSFAGLNDCMVYIIENFDWNPHCDGAKLLMSLIGRRYGHNA